ncbi:MAG: hypothetical protein ACXVFK_18035 [Solirubrobacteraceae bacterium]
MRQGVAAGREAPVGLRRWGAWDSSDWTYRTERIEFLEPVDEFAARGAGRALSSPVIDVDALPAGDEPLVVVPAAP